MSTAPLSTGAAFADLAQLQERADRASHRLASQRRMLIDTAGTPLLAPTSAGRLGIVAVPLLAAVLLALI